MSNVDVVEKFLSCYQGHNHIGMDECLSNEVKFSDFAFDIQGREVKAMWHWFSISYSPREEPVKVPEFEILSFDNETVVAKYRVSYLYRNKQRPVDYFIAAHFKLKEGKIVDQKDNFDSISQQQFIEMAFGPPLSWIASTPLPRIIVRIGASKKLKRFMDEKGY